MPPVASLLVRVWVGTERRQCSRICVQVNEEGGGLGTCGACVGGKRLNRQGEKVDLFLQRRLAV